MKVGKNGTTNKLKSNYRGVIMLELLIFGGIVLLALAAIQVLLFCITGVFSLILIIWEWFDE